MSSIKIHKLKVKEIVRETEEAITIRFENTNEKISYQSGQFITIILKINGQEVRRSYSLSSSPYVDSHLSVCVKEVDKGLASSRLNKELIVGDELEVMEPMGHFVLEPKINATRHIVLFGAGSGITPLLSIMKTVLSQEPESKVSLVYGNRTRESIIYKKELHELESKYGQRLNIVHFLSQPDRTWVGYSGRINQASTVNLVEKLVPLAFKQAEYYLCGPFGMTDEVLKALDLLDIPKDKIHKESFHATSSIAETPVTIASGGKSKITIKDGNKTYQFEAEAKNTILETALKLGYNLPYSCQAGMCTACMGKCTTGKVHMDNPDGLTDNEVKQGYVLTCIGHPAAAEIVIEL